MANQISFDLLLDPERNFKTKTLEVARIKLWTYLTPKATWRYLKWIFKARQGRPTAALPEPPAVAIVGTDGTIEYIYRGETLGDYPTIEEVMAELKRAAG